MFQHGGRRGGTYYLTETGRGNASCRASKIQWTTQLWFQEVPYEGDRQNRPGLGHHCLNWGSIGIFGLDIVAALFGGSASGLSRLVYILVCLSAIWCITLFFREDRVERTARGNA